MEDAKGQGKGRRYATGFGTVEVEDVSVIAAALVRRRDVKPSGLRNINAIWESAGEHTKTRVVADTLLHRVQFRFLGDVPVSAARAPETDLNALREHLQKMDRLSSRGPWTLRILRLIEDGPRVPARVLAAELGWQTLDFKANVRKIKALGLTISHDAGYELSDLARRYLTAASRRAGA